MTADPTLKRRPEDDEEQALKEKPSPETDDVNDDEEDEDPDDLMFDDTINAGEENGAGEGGGDEQQESAEGEPQEPVKPVEAQKPKEQVFQPVSESLTGHITASQFRDGLSDKITADVAEALTLPPAHPSRQQLVKDLTDRFDKPATYAEKIAAARSLIALQRGADGKLPEVISQRDVLIAEKTKWVGGGGGRGAQPAKLVVETPQHHELHPVKSKELLDFLERSAPEIQSRTQALLKTPPDSEERKSYVKHLVNVFQTASQESHEKQAAAQALIALCTKPDGSMPDLLGTRSILHAKVTRQEGGGRGGYRTVTVKEAYTENVDTSAQQVRSYLDARADGYLKRTEDALKRPENDPVRKQLIDQALKTYLDSYDPEDRAAAANALLALNRKPDGTYNDVLASRVVPIAAVTKYIPAVGGRGGAPARTEIVTPATTRTDTVKLDDAVQFLKWRAADPYSGSGRLVAADSLVRANRMTEDERKAVYERTLCDAKTPEHVKAHVRELLGLDKKDVENQKLADGRIEKPEVQPQTLKISKETSLKLATTIDRLLPAVTAAGGEEGKDVILPETIQAMKDELKREEFGPASRAVYNRCADFLNRATTDMAAALTHRNIALPPGCPIPVPRDISGRAENDQLFKEKLKAGGLKMDLKPLAGDEAPSLADSDKVKNAGEWVTSAARQLDSGRLRWQVDIFDQNIQEFNSKDDKLKAWKSREGMTDKQLEQLQASRAEWLGMALQVRNYAHTIANYNKASKESVDSHQMFWDPSVLGNENNIFPDEALQDGIFPGKVTRKDGKIASIELDLPRTLDRDDPANLAKMEKIREWMEKYGPKVDQATAEITKANNKPGRQLIWAYMPAEGKTDDGKPFNKLFFDISSKTIKAKDENGDEQTMVRVVNSKHTWYSNDLSYLGIFDYEVGKGEHHGKATINGQPLDQLDVDISVGKTGKIKIDQPGVEDNHCFVKTDVNGQIFIKDNSESGTFLNGKRLVKGEWKRIDPVGDSITFGPEPVLDIQSKDGVLTVNGQKVEMSLGGIAVGKKGPIKFEGTTAEENHALIRFDQGKVFIKDTSKSGTFVNGERVSKENWTEIDPTKDKVSLGQAPKMEADSDVRLYKPDDWVTILLDGKMQLLQAKDLESWTQNAKNWHYGGNVATAAMDAGMLVTGTIELRAVYLAAQKTAATITAKEIAKLTYKEVGKAMLKTEGFRRGAIHLGFGITGLTHQFMENQGDWGKNFNTMRGYAMMMDISWNTLAKPAGSLGAKMFGAGKTAEAIKEGSTISAYLKEAPKAVNYLKKGTDGVFLASNFYFIPEIVTHQFPTIYKSLSGQDSEAALLQGQRQRGGAYVSDDKRPPATEERALQFASPDLKKRAAEAAELGRTTADLKDEDPKKEEQRRKFCDDYLAAKNDDDKMVAAVALLNLAKRADGGYPESLGDRYKTKDSLPERVTLANVKRFLATKELESINAFDKQARATIEALQRDIPALKDSAADDPMRQAATAKFVDAFVNGKTTNDKLAGALALVSLTEKDGKLPDILGRISDGKGGTLEIKKEQVEAFLDGLNKQFSIDQFARYSKWMEKSEGGKHSQATAAALKLAPNDPQRLAQMGTLADLAKNSKDPKVQAEASICLLMLSRNTQNGSLPKVLAGDLKTEQVFKNLKANIASLPPGLRLSAGDLLYRAGQSSLHGQSAANDLGGILLSVLKDKNASDEIKMQAIVNSNGIGLAEILEKHRFEDEPAMERLKGLERLKAQADLSGRDSLAVQEALKAVASQPVNNNLPPQAQAQQRDLKALALSTLMANAEMNPEKRLALLQTLHAEYGQNQQEAGAYARKYFEHMRDNLSTKGYEPQDRLTRYQAALVLKTSGQAETYGVSEKQLLDVFMDCVRPNEPELAQQAFDHVLPQFANLSPEQREKLLDHISYALKSNASDPTAGADLLRREWIGRIAEIAQKTDAEKVLSGFKNDLDDKIMGAREIFKLMLTPGTPEFKGATAESRAAAAKALSVVGSNDLATRTLLKNSLGLEGGTADPSALVRNETFNSLVKLNPPGLRDTCLELLTRETDSELLRRIKGIESSERRQDPSSEEYKERFRVALRDLLASNKRSLVGSEEYLRDTFPLLDGPTLRKQEIAGHVEKYYKDFGGFLNWSFSSQKTIDAHHKGEIERVGKEMNAQFDDLINRAKTDDGDQARRALAWIVMSNAKSFSMAEKEEAVKRAAEGLRNVAENGSAKAKEAIAPIVTMCLTTQDRMPFAARVSVLDALEVMKPGTPGSAISQHDAGIAALAALRRQFHNTPNADGNKRYEESHELQRRLLGACEKYMKAEGIPIMEAIAEERTKSVISRDAREQVHTVNYADKSIRKVERDEDGKIWKDTYTSADGKTTTMIREGKSDIWYASTDTEKKNPWRGQPYFENDTGNYVRKDAYGNETVTAPSGARAERKDGIVSKVQRADGTIYEVLRHGTEPYRTIRTDANGIKTIWNREGNSDKWFQDTDKAKKSPWSGSVKFDAKTLDYVYTTSDNNKTTIMKADGGMRVLKDGEPFFSGPGVDDASTHPMPVIRDKARELLSRLRDDTGAIRAATQSDAQADAAALAAKLQSVISSKESTSEDVVKAVFASAISSPIKTADDPRRAVLQGLLNDPHERIQLATARMLFTSANKEDRERAAEVIADLQKNASRVGYRRDAQALADEVKANPAKFQAGDDQLLKDAFERVKTHAQPRQEVATARIAMDRPIEHQEAYEIAKAEMLRDSQRSLAKFSGPDWWKKNGYELIDERNLPEAGKAAIKSVEPGFFKFWTSWESTLQKERDDALKAVNERFNTQFKNLLTAAEKEGAEGTEAREALSYIVLSQGEPFDPRNRNDAMGVAAGKLAQIYEKGGPAAGDIEWTMKAALVANPNIPRDVREVFALAAIKRYADELQGKVPPGRMTRHEVSTLMIATLESEYMAMPQPGQAGHAESVKMQKELLGLTEALADRVAMPVVEAIAQGHPDQEMRNNAKAYFEKMRDSVDWIAGGVKPDITTSPQAKADLLRQVLTTKKVDDEFAVRELFRLSSPGSLPLGKDALHKDPRAQVLTEALSHPNERVRFAAARILANRDASVEAMTAVAEMAEYTTRPGLKKEARDFLDSGIKNANAPSVIAMAEAILKHNGESKELMPLLQDRTKTPNLPITHDSADGRQVVVRRTYSGATVIEQFKDGKLEKNAVSHGNTYSQVLLDDSSNHHFTGKQRAQAARDALMTESYGKLSADERNRAIKNLAEVVADPKTDEKTRLEMAKFLGSEASLRDTEAAAARVKAFDAIVDLAAHGKETRAEAKKIITADVSAEVQAMRSLNRALSGLNSRSENAKDLVAENLQLQAELLKTESSEREALFYASIVAAEKVVGGDAQSIIAAAALVDRTSKDHKLTALSGSDDPRIPALHMALSSANSTVSASAALALLDSSLKADVVPDLFKSAAREPMLRHTQELFGKATEIEQKKDAKETLAAWSHLENTLKRVGENPENLNYVYASMKRMAAELGPTHKDLAPMYAKLAKLYEEGNHPDRATKYRQKERDALGLPPQEEAKPNTQPPKAKLPAEFEKRMSDAVTVAREAVAAKDVEKMKASKKDLLEVAKTLRETEGASSLHLAAVLSQTGNLMMQSGNEKEGAVVLKEAAQIYGNSDTDSLPEEAVESLLGLTKYYSSTGNTGEFKEYQGRMLNLSKMRGYKSIEVKTAEAFTQLADHMALQSDEKDAMNEVELMLKEAERLTTERSGPVSMETALATRKLADFYMKPGNPNANGVQAEALLKQTLRTMEMANPVKGEEWAVTSAKAANCLRMRGEYNAACAQFGQAMDALMASPTSNPVKFAEIQSAYAETLSHTPGRMKEAEELMRDPVGYRTKQRMQPNQDGLPNWP